MEDQGTNRNGLIHIPAGSEVPDRTSIEAPVHRFQLIDDLHRAHFRRTDERARRKRRGEEIKSISARSELRVDSAHDVHHMAVSFDRAIWVDVHAARPRDTPEIVARQVDQHHMFGALLWISQQLDLTCAVNHHIIGPRPCSGDRAKLRPAALEFHERFGR